MISFHSIFQPKMLRAFFAYLVMLAIYLWVALVLQSSSIYMISAAVLLGVVIAELVADIVLKKIVIFYLFLGVFFPIAILFAIGRKTDSLINLAARILRGFNWVEVAAILAAAAAGYFLAKTIKE